MNEMHFSISASPSILTLIRILTSEADKILEELEKKPPLVSVLWIFVLGQEGSSSSDYII